VTLLFDLLSYFGGWSLIGYQALAVPPKDVNEWFLLLGGSMIGVPGVAEILSWRGRQGGTGDTAGSSPSPDSPSQPSSSSA
jgi:hypothetical protein